MDQVADHRIADVEDASMEWPTPVPVNHISPNGCIASFFPAGIRVDFNLLKMINHLEDGNFLEKHDIYLGFFHNNRSPIAHKLSPMLQNRLSCLSRRN